MKNTKNFFVFLLSLVLILSAAGCGNNTAVQQKAAQVNLTVSAASSLKDAMEEIKTNYAQENANITITYNFAGSGSLQQQIEQGAAVDIFVSAGTKQIDALKDKGLLLDDTRRNLLGNQLVLITPKGSSTATNIKDLADEKFNKIALGVPTSVPAGQYAEETLTKNGLLSTLKNKIVYAKDVKEVLTWVETGNAEAGFVYATDAKTSEKVTVAAVASEDTHSPILYPAAVIKASKNTDAAKNFINYLYSDKARVVFEKYGFSFIAK